MGDASMQGASSTGSPALSTAQGGGVHANIDIARLAPWFHNLHLPDGNQTVPDHPLGDFPARKWREIEPHLPQSLEGWRVLDIGCNAGFYCFALADRGADVLGIDTDEHYLRQARWAAERISVRGKVRFERMSIYMINRLGESFDIVWFMGVFYHLRYPLLGLDLAASKAKRLLAFQSMSMPGEEPMQVLEDLPIGERRRLLEPQWPKMAFIEKAIQGDATNWWVPNHACIVAMLASVGMQVTVRPGHETYLCEPASA